MLAALTSTPELALREEQAKRLAGALAEVGKHHKLPALAPDKMALAMLFWTAGSVYLPMGQAIVARKRGDPPRPDADPSSGLTDTTVFQTPVAPAGPWFQAVPGTTPH